MNERKLKRNKETHTCICERNKGEKTLSTFDNEDNKKEETVNSRDGETANARNDSFSIYECCKQIFQSMYK